MNIQAFALGRIARLRNPAEGLQIQAVPINWAGVPVTIDASILQGQNANQLSYLRAIQVSNQTYPLEFVFGSGQKITLPAATESVLNVLQPNPVRFSVAQPGAAGNQTILSLLNFIADPQMVPFFGGFDGGAFQPGAFQ